MNDRTAAPIALFDSGAGGIGVLREVQKLLPREQLVYFGDSRNAPYGERSAQEVKELVLFHGERLLKNAKALVLACNTATAVAAATLRQRYPGVPIIGMEPALRPAVHSLKNPKVLVLATAATLSQEKYRLLQKKYEKNATVWSIPAPGLVRLVEAGHGDSPQTDAYLRTLLADLPTPPDAVVLGCTHFPFATNALHRVLGDIPLWDGAAGAAAQLKRVLEQKGLSASTGAVGSTVLNASDPRSLPLFLRLLHP